MAKKTTTKKAVKKAVKKKVQPKVPKKASKKKVVKKAVKPKKKTVKKSKAIKKYIKGDKVKKHHHPLIVYFVVILLLFTVSFQFGKYQRTLNAKQVAAELITEQKHDLALEYCRQMEFRNYECFEMYIDAKELLNEDYDKLICQEMNVGKLPWWLPDTTEFFVEFRRVKNKCYAQSALLKAELI